MISLSDWHHGALLLLVVLREFDKTKSTISTATAGKEVCKVQVQVSGWWRQQQQQQWWWEPFLTVTGHSTVSAFCALFYFCIFIISLSACNTSSLP
jgi:hypothetical protein